MCGRLLPPRCSSDLWRRLVQSQQSPSQLSPAVKAAWAGLSPPLPSRWLHVHQRGVLHLSPWQHRHRLLLLQGLLLLHVAWRSEWGRGWCPSHSFLAWMTMRMKRRHCRSAWCHMVVRKRRRRKMMSGRHPVERLRRRMRRARGKQGVRHPSRRYWQRYRKRMKLLDPRMTSSFPQSHSEMRPKRDAWQLERDRGTECVRHMFKLLPEESSEWKHWEFWTHFTDSAVWLWMWLIPPMKSYYIPTCHSKATPSIIYNSNPSSCKVCYSRGTEVCVCVCVLFSLVRKGFVSEFCKTKVQ